MSGSVVRNRILSILLLASVFTCVFVIGYYRFSGSEKVQKAANNRPELSSKDVVSGVADLDSMLDKDPHLLSDSIPVGLVSSDTAAAIGAKKIDHGELNEQYAMIRSEIVAKYGSTNLEKLDLIVRSVGARDNALTGKIAIAAAKYGLVSDIKKKIELGQVYSDQILLLSNISEKDATINDMVAFLKDRKILDISNLVLSYRKIHKTMLYEIFKADNNPTFIEAIVFKVRQYIGVREVGYIDEEEATINMIKNRKYCHLFNGIKKYSFKDIEVREFYENISALCSLDDKANNALKGLTEDIIRLST